VSRFVPFVASLALVAGAITVGTAASQPARAASWGYVSLENVLAASDLGIAEPGALRFDAVSGALAITDEATGLGKLVGTQGAVKDLLSRREAPDRGRFSARASNGHVFTLDAKAGLISEADASGAIIRLRDVSALQMKGVGGITAAPTSDMTDAADATSLYVSVADASDDGSGTGPAVLELSLTAPVLAAAVASVPDHDGNLVRRIMTDTWNPFSPDPSGITYDSSIDRLLVADGEIDEENVNNYPYPGKNVWEANRVTGAGTGILDTLAASPTNTEAVGIGYDADKDELIISKDGSSSRVWAYVRGGGGGWVLRSSTPVSGFGVADAEGVAVANGKMFIADGSNKQIWVIGPGNDGKLATSDDVRLADFDTAVFGITDPEGIGVHPLTGNLWIVSHKDGQGMIETTQDGTLVSTTHFAFTTDNPGGVEIAPSSSTTDDPTTMSAWVAQRGVDNNDDPNEKDGQVIEVSIEEGAPPPPPPDPGENLLLNGDFEAGAAGAAPPSWSSNGNFTTSTDEHQSGTKSGRHNGAEVSYKIEQTVDVTGGQTYNYGVWVKPLPTTDTFRVVFKLQWRNTKAINTVILTKVSKTSAGTWTHYELPFAAPATATKGKVFMVVNGLNGTVFVDDISLAAPAP
jgi:hypothetical protein